MSVESASKKVPLSGRFGRSFTPFLLFVLVAIFDPLGIYSVSNKASRDLAFRALSLWQDTAAAKHVAIVLLDDASADALNGEYGYPITFQNHADIVRTILCPGPASLFIDFSFRNIRTRDQATVVAPDGQEIAADLDAFVRALSTRPEADGRFCPPVTTDGRRSVMAPEVMIARTRSAGSGDCDPLFEEQAGPLPEKCRAARMLARLAASARPLTLARADADGAYPVAVLPSETFSHPPTGIDERLAMEASPALGAVLAFCRLHPVEVASSFRGCRERDRLAELITSPDAARRLVPVWPYFPTDGGEALRSPRPCPPGQTAAADNHWQRATLLAREIGRTLYRSLAQSDPALFGKGLCLPYDTTTAAQLIELASNCGNEDIVDCRKRQAAVTAGRMVFYGAQVADVHDDAESPVLGIVPGVAMHAAAAANLLQFGTSYVRHSGEIPLLHIEWITLIEISVVFAWFILLVGWRPSWLLGDQALSPVLLRLSFALALALALTTWLYVAFCYTPANWVALAAALYGTAPSRE